MKKILQKLSFSALLLAPAIVSANDSKLIDNFYVGVDAGVNNGMNNNSVFEDNLATGDVNFGVKANKNFAFETGYFQSANSKQNGTIALNDEVFNTSVKERIRGGYLDAIGILPITDNFSALALVGGNYTQVKEKVAVGTASSDHKSYGFAPEAGIGLQYDLSQNLALRARVKAVGIQGNEIFGNDGVIETTAGLQYKFQ